MPSGDFMLLSDLFLLIAFGFAGGAAITAGLFMQYMADEMIKQGGTFPGIRAVPWTIIVIGLIVVALGIGRAFALYNIIQGLPA